MRFSGERTVSELSDRMNLIVSSFAAAYPARVVTRKYIDRNLLSDVDLTAGTYAVLSRGERGFANLPQRAAMDGTQDILVAGQFRLAETATGEDIDDAEFAMVEEWKSFVRALPPGMCRLEMIRWAQSTQIEHPNGWVAISLEYIP
jgi:hypothetical protein